MLSQEQIVAVLGPLSTSLEGIKLFMKTVISGKPWLTEPSLLPLPWAEHKYFNTTIKVAVMWNDSVVQPHPPVTRALTQVVDRLKSVQDIQVVDWKPYKHDEAWDIVSHLYFGDGAKEEIEALEASGEPWRPLSEFIIKENPNVQELSVPELWHWTGRREAYRTAYANAWNETGTGDESGSVVDVILCPVGPGAAPKLDHAKYWSYTSQWNLLDYPALIFPVTKADPSKDIWSDEFKPLSKADAANHATYQNPTEYAGAPVGLQLVGRRYEDEKVCLLISTISQIRLTTIDDCGNGFLVRQGRVVERLLLDLIVGQSTSHQLVVWEKSYHTSDQARSIVESQCFACA